MATIRPLAQGERRDVRCAGKYDLTPAQRAFAEVSVEWFAGPPVLRIVFGSLYFEMPEPLARDFGARIARAMRTRVAPDSRRGFRCAPGMARADREYVEVLLQDRDGLTQLRLEFADGNTVDFSAAVGTCFADRIRRAVAAMPAPAVLAA